MSATTSHCSVREVEVVVSVVIVFTLAKARHDEVEGDRDEANAAPDSPAEINHIALNHEALDTAVHEVEEPLLRGVRAVMPDVTSSERALLVEVLLAVPGSPLLLGDAQALAEGHSDVLCVSELVVGKSTSCKN